MGAAVLLFRAHTLPGGTRVRVRLPHRTDLSELTALHARVAGPVGDLEARRMLRFDPRERATVVATAWIAGAERMVGFGVAAPSAEPAPFLVDEEAAGGLGPVLRDALRERLSRVA
jgi:hypothetical protein